MTRKVIPLISILMILAMVVQIGVVSSNNELPEMTVKKAIQNLNPSNKDSVANSQDTKPFVDSIRKFVLHFRTKAALNNYLANNEPKFVFPNLKMVIVNDWLSKESELQSIPGVDGVFDVTNTKYTYIEPPQDTNYLVAGSGGVALTQESAEFLNVDDLWALGYRGEGIVVYDIDSGINYNHVDFEDRILLNISLSFINSTYGYKQNDPSLDDPIGHGTHTAGIIAGAGIANPDYIGMAPKAYLLIAKLGSPAPPEAFLGAFDYGMSLGIVDVINLSWGGTDVAGQDVEEVAVKELMLNGILIAIAAGNSADQTPIGYYSAESPGSAPQGISVAATTVQGKKAAFSSVGPTADGFVKPDVAAPGVDIMSCGTKSTTDYVQMSGTSMATPHIAGVAAVLIQALKDLGIPYDTGLIKTALMKSADPQNYEYLALGAGVPDVKLALDLIKTAPRNGSGFPVILWAIPEVPISKYKVLPQGFYTEFYIESVSSTPYEDQPPVISGNITSIVSLNTTPATGPWAKNYKITVNIPDDAELGLYEGYIYFETSQGVNATTYIQITVTEGKGKILYAKLFTDWKIDFYLGQYYYVIEDLMEQGYAVNEIQNAEITPELLSGYDCVWIFDPFSYEYPNIAEGDTSYVTTYRPLTQDELVAIHDYIAGGGTLLIDLLGIQSYYVESLGVTIDTGNNVTVVNQILDPYSITVSSARYSFEKPEPAVVVKSHAITEGVSKIDHYGTYLTVGDEATILTTYNGKGTTAIYENDNGGRVFVATTNFFFDTEGYFDKYNDGTNNNKFVKNLFKWLLAEEKISGTYTRSGDTVTFEIKVLPSDAQVSATVTFVGLSETSTKTVQLQEVSPGVYTYTLTFEEEGTYIFKAETSDDFYYAELLYDNSPPIVRPIGWTNNTVPELARIDFEIRDNYSSIVSVSIKLNDKSINWGGSGKRITFQIFGKDLQDGDNILDVTATDAAGNTVKVRFVIPTKAKGAPFSMPAAIIGLIAFAAIVTILRRKKN